MKYLFSFLFFVTSVLSYAQTTVAVKGVVSADTDVLSLGTISIFRQSDSLLVKGTYLDSNSFELVFRSEFNEEYYAKIKIPEYTETIIEFEAKDSLVNLGVITPEKNKELKTIDIVYEKELFVRTMDGVTVNVEGTNLQTLTNLFEILKASPKISSPDDENIEIIGRGRPLILVDRQAIISTDELRAIPANQVEKVEIITNPSARYKAQGSGNGVIEVYTKNFHLEGYNFTVSGASGISTQMRPAANLNLGLNLKKKKFSLNGYLGANYNASNGFGEGEGETSDSTLRTVESTYNNDRYNTWQYYNVKGAYHINKKQRITLGMNGYGSRGANTSTSDTRYYQSGDQINEVTEVSENSWTWQNNAAFINYTVETDTNKSNFEINLNYTNKVSKSDNASESQFRNFLNNDHSEFAVRNDSKDIPNIGELRVNYEHIFDTTGWKLSSGASYSLLLNGKSLDRYQHIDNEWVKNEAQSNSYDYSENIGAVFVELTKNWEKISARAGLRTEYTGLKGFSNSLNKTFIDSSYILPFPSASIMWKMSQTVSTTLFFDTGIDRPQFDNFDPFVIQNDSLSIEYGNPYLRPAIERTVGADLDLFYKYNLSLTYTFTNEPFSEVSFISDDSFVQERTPWNADDKKSLSLSVSAPITTKWLSGWNSIWSSYDQYNFTPIFGRPAFNILTYGFYSNMTFKLPASFDLTNRLHISKWGQPSISIAANVNWGARVIKKFGGNRYQVYFDIDNIIPPKYQQTNYAGNYQIISIGQNRFTTFKVGFFTKFGRLKASDQIQESKSGQSGRI